MSGLVAASSSTHLLRVIIFNKFSFFVKKKYCLGHSNPKRFFQLLMVLNQPSKITSSFPDISLKYEDYTMPWKICPIRMQGSHFIFESIRFYLLIMHHVYLTLIGLATVVSMPWYKIVNMQICSLVVYHEISHLSLKFSQCTLKPLLVGFNSMLCHWKALHNKSKSCNAI